MMMIVIILKLRPNGLIDGFKRGAACVNNGALLKIVFSIVPVPVVSISIFFYKSISSSSSR